MYKSEIFVNAILYINISPTVKVLESLILIPQVILKMCLNIIM